MCQSSHSAQADFHGMPFGKAEFVAHPSYWQEAVNPECSSRAGSSPSTLNIARIPRAACWVERAERYEAARLAA